MTEPQTLRLYDLLEECQTELAALSAEQLEGATRILQIIHTHLYSTHFIKRHHIDQKALVKTIEECFESSMEHCIHKNMAIIQASFRDALANPTTK